MGQHLQEPRPGVVPKGVVERWNEQLAASRGMLWSPTIRAALIAGTPWLDVFCPGCGTSRATLLDAVLPQRPAINAPFISRKYPL
jgi:hypothetical protein